MSTRGPRRWKPRQGLHNEIRSIPHQDVPCGWWATKNIQSLIQRRVPGKRICQAPLSNSATRLYKIRGLLIPQSLRIDGKGNAGNFNVWSQIRGPHPNMK